MNLPAHPLSKQALGVYVNDVVTQSADNVLVTKHCELRMDERGITRREMWTCLRRGIVVGEPTYNPDYGTWEFKFQEPAPRDIVCVVVAAELAPTNNSVITLTVYEV
jgi:hypothetical protein